MIRKVTLITAAAATILGSMVFATPAFATSGDGNCESGEYCVYRDAGYGLPMRDNYISNSNYSGQTYVNNPSVCWYYSNVGNDFNDIFSSHQFSTFLPN
jgi:hypothetical protein